VGGYQMEAQPHGEGKAGYTYNQSREWARRCWIWTRAKGHCHYDGFYAFQHPSGPRRERASEK